jgi:hypothetical protein
MRALKIFGSLILVLTLTACTDVGSWDYINDLLFGDVLDNFYARFTFDDNINPAHDSSGNGFHGTMNGATWINDGSRGGVLEFDGLDDYVAVPTINENAPELTICTWVRVDALTSLFSSIYCVSTWNPRGIHYQIKSTGEIQTGIGGFTPPNINSSYSVDPAGIGRWIHVAMVYDYAAARTVHYVNGERDRTGVYTTADDLNLGDAWIGGWVGGSPPGNLRWFDGRIDDLRLYSRVLSDNEIRRVYNATRN